MICEYGCGQEANYLLKSGKWCCSKSVNSCFGKIKKVSISKKGKTPSWKNGHPRGMLGKTPWNKGLTKEIDGRCRLSEETVKKIIKKKIENGTNGVAGTAEKERERKEKISKTMKEKRLGGKRHGSGRGKKGWYKGYFCDSSWELAFVIYNLEHGIKFERNKQGFEYEFNGEKHKFYPDFILENGTYVEIKGAMTEQNKVKINSFNGPLSVLDKYGIKIYLDYVESKYGKDFIKLYMEE